jgi:hypothetical protein
MVDLLATFLNKNITYPCYQTSYLNEEVNCTEPSLSVNVPWIVLFHSLHILGIGWFVLMVGFENNIVLASIWNQHC